MANLKYKIVESGKHFDQLVPLNIILVDVKDIKACGLTTRQAMDRIAKEYDDPCCINCFDMSALTTTSDGLVVEGAIIDMAASDRHIINPDFGYLKMCDVPLTEERFKKESYLLQAKRNYPGRHVFMGPKPEDKNVPVHCCAITGRATNNNSATEVWNVITMEEMLLPIMGQLEIMRDGECMVAKTGGIISVGIGMVVGEEYSRLLTNHAYECGQTAHRSGNRAQTLKRDMPLISCSKKVFAENVIKALNCGMVPGRDIGPAPSILTIAKHLGKEVDYDNIEESAYDELASVGFTKEWMKTPLSHMTEEELIARADEVIPGGEDIHECAAKDLYVLKYVTI